MILSTLTTAAGLLTIVLGGYVTYLAYRGYQRNGSESMRALAIGVLFIAVIPYVVSIGVTQSLGLTDAQAILGVTISHTIGLGAILRSFGES